MMKRLIIFFSLATLCYNQVLCQEPDITMTSSMEIGSDFSFYLKADMDNNPIQVDFGDGILIDFIIGKDLVKISNNICGSGIVKVYGSGISYLDCSSNQLTNLDLKLYSSLTYLACSDNQLISLPDLSKDTLLTVLACAMNQLIVLPELPIHLEHLNCFINNLTSLPDLSKNCYLTDLNCWDNHLSTFPGLPSSLVSIDCGNNELTSLQEISECYELSMLRCSGNNLTSLADLSMNYNLNSIVCEFNDLEYLPDLTSNVNLVYLYCDYNQLLSLPDLSANKKLYELACRYNQLSDLPSFSSNTELLNLFCNNNMLTSLPDFTLNIKLQAIDFSGNNITKFNNFSTNPDLLYINCSNNQITNLPDLTLNDLSDFWCYNNKLNFATLPSNPASWTYYYAPQKSVKIDKIVCIGNQLDLSSQYSIYGNITKYVWKTENGLILVEGVDYTIFNGISTFISIQPDSIYCEMTNLSFPDFTGENVLKTTCTKIVSGTSSRELLYDKSKIYSYSKTIYIDILYDAQLRINDINGKLILSHHIDTGMNSFQMQKSGIYIVHLVGNSSSLTKKIYIQ